MKEIIDAIKAWAMQDAEVWQFWMPQSGLLGGVMVGMVILTVGVLLGAFA